MFLLDRLFRKMIRDGDLTVIDASGTLHRYGKPTPGRPAVRIRLTDKATARRIALKQVTA